MTEDDSGFRPYRTSAEAKAARSMFPVAQNPETLAQVAQVIIDRLTKQRDEYKRALEAVRDQEDNWDLIVKNALMGE